MKFKFKTKLFVLISFLLVFSANGFGQIIKLQSVWLLQSIQENGSEIPLIDHTPNEKTASIRLSIMRSSFNYNGACNSTGGKYQAEKNGRIKFNSLRSTIMYCDGGAMDIDRSLEKAFSKTTKYKIKDKFLTLSDGSGKFLLIFKYDSPISTATKR